MTNDLKSYIESLPINTYVLSNNDLIIGRKLDEDTDTVELNAVCRIDDVYLEDEDQVHIHKTINQYIPYNLDQNSILNKTSILIETPASFNLKYLYCQSLLKFKINSELLSTSTSLEQTNNNSDKSNNRWNF